MTVPKNGDTVSIDYVLRRGDGEIVGHTQDVGPQDIQIGGGEIFPQVEQALVGMAIGDEQSVSIESTNAFGPRRDELVIEIPRDNLPPDTEPEQGMALRGQQPDGSPVTLYVVEVNEQTVKADANHPLAGEDLTFDITLRSIKQSA
jgi:FKBP-type peptidyl-prolyl cis-trans isomerase 2